MKFKRRYRIMGETITIRLSKNMKNYIYTFKISPSDLFRDALFKDGYRHSIDYSDGVER